jgi:glyoxylase I family protein
MKAESLPGFSRVDHFGLTVPDLEAAVRFYCEVFGATEINRLGPFDARELPATNGCDWCEAHVNVAGARFRFVMLQLGPGMMLELFEYDRPLDRKTELPRNCDLGGHHLALKVENLDRAVEYLRRQPGVKVMAGPIVVTDGLWAGMRVNYFLDPWGNQLELVEFDRPSASL